MTTDKKKRSATQRPRPGLETESMPPGEDRDFNADVTLHNSIATHKPHGGFASGNPYAFKPGQSGNPAGRPKGIRYISEGYRERLAQINGSDAQGRTNAEVIADIIVGAALSGDTKAITEVTDRTEGRPKQIFVSLEPPNPLQSEQWIALRSAIAGALEPFPDARDAILRVLAEHQEGE